MLTFLYALIFIGIIIFLHELGHFLFAKLMKVKVKTFSIGFGPSLLEIQFRGTSYKISLIPFGGYVRLLGEDEDEKDLEGSLFSKRPHQRILIFSAGSIFNFFTAVLVYTFFNLIGYDVFLPVVGEVLKGYPAEKVLKPGDIILQIDGKKIELWTEVYEVINRAGDKELEFLINREGKEMTFRIRPRKEMTEEKEERYLVGIKPSPEHKKRVREGFMKSIFYGMKASLEISALTLRAIWGLITGEIPPSQLSGPIFIMKTAGEAGKEGMRKFLHLLALISINIALLNLFPFPALDGGHILISFIEMLIRREASLKLKRFLQILGLSLLLILFVFIIYNDIIHITKGK